VGKVSTAKKFFWWSTGASKTLDIGPRTRYYKGMKAVLHQVPELEKSVNQAHQSTAPIGDRSNLWAVLRRLKAQIGQIELVLSALKRDCARIDRRQYRDKSEEPPSVTPGANEQFPPGLFD